MNNATKGDSMANPIHLLRYFVRTYLWARGTQTGTRRYDLTFAARKVKPAVFRPYRRRRNGFYA
jgi:hypothetical protein